MGSMNEASFRALADHAPLLLAMGSVLVILGAVLRGAFNLSAWNEKRTERLVTHIIASAPVQKAVADIATAVFATLSVKDAELRMEIATKLEDLRTRDVERMGAVQRCHQRIDDIQGQLLGLATNTPQPRRTP